MCLLHPNPIWISSVVIRVEIALLIIKLLTWRTCAIKKDGNRHKQRFTSMC
jgi:hypothetical protein